MKLWIPRRTPCWGKRRDAQRFAREAQVLKNLRQPHILGPRLYGQDEAIGLQYIMLPYLDGGTLGVRVAAGTLALDEATRILASRHGARAKFPIRR